MAKRWVQIFDFEGSGSVARTVPLNMVLAEACKSKCMSASGWQVKRFWEIMQENEFYPADRVTKTKIYADGWGIRKLITYLLRNMRQQRVARAP